MIEPAQTAPYDIFGAFAATPICQEFQGIMDRRLQYYPAEPGRRMQEFRGGLFEQLAYGMMQERVPGGQLLSPDDTLDFYHGLFPDAQIHHNFFTSTLHGVSVPDGLVMAGNTVVGLMNHHGLTSMVS